LISSLSVVALFIKEVKSSTKQRNSFLHNVLSLSPSSSSTSGILPPLCTQFDPQALTKTDEDAVMAPSLDNLPMEILLRIAEMSTWGVSPSSDKAHPATYARNHASLARTCRWLYETLNGELYKRNLKKDPVTESCVLWAVNIGSLDTVKRAVAYGASLDLQVEVDEKTAYCPPWGALDLDLAASPRRQPSYPRSFSLLHLAVGRQHVNIVQYLLEKGVDVHAPSSNFCCVHRLYGRAPLYPLHICLWHDHRHEIRTEWHPLRGANQSSNKDSELDLVELLVNNGAFLVAEGVSAIHNLSFHERRGLITRLLSYPDPVSLREKSAFCNLRKRYFVGG
jgi:hypothetical protein